LTEDGQTLVKTVPHPLRQCREYMLGLMDQLRKQPLLCWAEGEHQGQLLIPCGFGVLLTNITREQLQAAGLDAVFPTGPVLCRDELTALETARNDQTTLRRLRQMFPADFPFDPLTAEQLKTVQGVIHKEVQVKSPPAGGVLEVLDAKQEQLA